MAKQNEGTVKGPTGKRYSPETKKEIADYLKSLGDERGAIKKTMEKFGVSYILIRSIMDNATKKSPGRPKSKNGSEKVTKNRSTNPALVRLLKGFQKNLEIYLKKEEKQK